jgi:hypothetical protein
MLDLANVTEALRHLDDDEKAQASGNIINPDVAPGGRDPFIISESGLYSLILRSRKPEAKAFKRWVTHEVIPAIRKTGAYAVDYITQYNLAHATTARDYWETQKTNHESGRLPHSPGRTYAVMVAPLRFKVGYSSGKSARTEDVVECTLNRLKKKGNGILLRTVTGGWTREQEVSFHLESFRSNDGVDFYAATAESLAIVQAYKPSRDARQIEDAYNRWQLVSSTRRASLAIAA